MQKRLFEELDKFLQGKKGLPFQREELPSANGGGQTTPLKPPKLTHLSANALHQDLRRRINEIVSVHPLLRPSEIRDQLKTMGVDASTTKIKQIVRNFRPNSKA